MGTVLMVAGMSLDLFFSHRLLTGFDESLLNRAQALAILTEQEEEGIGFEFVNEPESEFSMSDPQVFFQFWLLGGEVLKRSQSLGDSNLPLSTRPTSKNILRNLLLPNGQAGRMISIEFEPRMDDEAAAGSIQSQLVLLAVARERATLDNALMIIHLGLASTIVFLMGMLVLVTRYSITQGLKPLDDIRDQVANLDVTALNSRLSPAVPTAELEGVVTQFNGLLTKMERAFNRERQFSADVAHELRTPLAELRNLSEVAMRWPDDPTLAKEFYGDVLNATLQMEGITTQLLTLSRSEQINTTPNKELFDLPDLILSVWSKIKSGQSDSTTEPIFTGPSSLPINSDPEIIELILSNLISNALTYGEGQIECEHSVDNNILKLSISNQSQDLTTEDLSHLFDRFWRKDKSRTGDKHAGLGLSLVKSYADMLHFNVTVSLDESEKIFTVTFTGPVQ